ncbi:MAG TPA: ribonuclease P protein component [Propionibacteriaceae bacterium]
MRSSDEFRGAVRDGVRTGRRTLVVHATSSAEDDVRVGFVVSKAVGNAVTRNRVKRRLRHLCLTELAATPEGTRIVVRALPAAADHPSDLGPDLTRAWGKALARVRRRDLERRQAAGRAGT